MNIDTGGFHTSAGPACEDNRPVQNEHHVLFDPSSTFLQSGPIVVRPNRPLMLVGYMVPEGAEFVVEGVSLGSRAVQHGGGCCSPCGPSLLSRAAADILFREPMTLGGSVWKINELNRHLVLTLPGSYILSLNSDEYLGSIHVELVELGEVQAPIPAGYMAGLNYMVAET